MQKMTTEAFLTYLCEEPVTSNFQISTNYHIQGGGGGDKGGFDPPLRIFGGGGGDIPSHYFLLI